MNVEAARFPKKSLVWFHPLRLSKVPERQGGSSDEEVHPGKRILHSQRMITMMKKTMLWGAWSVLFLAACDQKPAADVANSASMAAPTPEGSPFAPPGVFFLVKKVSLETDSGIIGYPPGSKVHLVGRQYVTRDGRHLTLRAEQVTNDLRIAEGVAGHDAAAQAAIRSTRRMPVAPPAAVVNASPGPVVRPIRGEVVVADIHIAPASPRPALGASSPLNEKAYGRTEAFVDTDGDGKKFDFRQKSRQ